MLEKASAQITPRTSGKAARSHALGRRAGETVGISKRKSVSPITAVERAELPLHGFPASGNAVPALSRCCHLPGRAPCATPWRECNSRGGRRAISERGGQ